jgi:ATP-binding cassette subfamily B (MDR/TAP) protein 1
VALVGETGCGKSTTVQLIERFYDPEAGSVSIDGKDLKSYNLTALRKFIGYVGQEPVLFAMSIRDNLLLAKPDAKDSELIDALKKANAYHFVQNLENKIDTYVGSGGSQLSGGQKQRISIARSILQDPKILLLDEATSALDRKNEREIQETLEKFSNGRTTVTIAHRLSTIINSDIIFVLEKGRVVEQGTHQSLIEKNGIYAKLVRFQLDGQSLDSINKPDQATDVQMNAEIRSAKDVKEVVVVVAGEDSLRGTAKKVMTDEQKKEQKVLESVNNKKFFGQLRGYLNGNYGILIMGCLCALAGGCIMPLFALFMADMIDVLSKFDLLRREIPVEGYSFDRLKTESLYIGLYFLILAVVSFTVYLGQFSFFGLLGQRITYKLRLNLYKHLLTRDMAFFDKKENNPGELTAVLAKDCLTVNAIVSSSYSAILNGAGSFICGTLIAMFSSWRIALISLCVSPIMILAGVIEASKLHKSETPPGEEDTTETKIFQESTTNMRTINSMNSQNLVFKMFSEQCDKDYALRIGAIVFNTSLYAIGQFSMFAVYALIFYVGAVFTVEYNLSFQDLFRALFSVIFSAFGVGMSAQFMGNVSGAKIAAKKIFAMLNIPNDIKQKDNPVTKPIAGNIEFRNVAFTYPTRKEPVFTNVSFKIDSKQKVAFVGSSGCGKSSIYGLIMRFYDVDKGEILIDGVNIKDYDIKTLRSGLGIVSQEPTLFNNTIEYNIRYNKASVSMREIEDAAKTANAYNFITSDQKEVTSEVDKIVAVEGEEGDGQGFNRKVGIKGGKLSGGQKQRVAIARTVVRKPQVYMFDEATSALDTESERIVQDAINKLITQDTSLTIAHRISTVKDSDIIYVIDQGQVVEQGSFNELMNKKGVFYTISKDK